MGSDAPTPAREEGLQPYGALYCFGRRSEGGAGGRAESHPACVNGQQLCRKQFPLAGLDAPTPARIGTGRPKGCSHFSFGGERKVCKRKPAARRLREKALYCPFLKEGVRNVARNGVGQLSPALGARSCSLFSSFKKGKAFSLRCLSPLCSPAVDARHTQIAVLGMFQCSLDDGAAQKNRIVFFCG